MKPSRAGRTAGAKKYRLVAWPGHCYVSTRTVCPRAAKPSSKLSMRKSPASMRLPDYFCPESRANAGSSLSANNSDQRRDRNRQRQPGAGLIRHRRKLKKPARHDHANAILDVRSILVTRVTRSPPPAALKQPASIGAQIPARWRRKIAFPLRFRPSHARAARNVRPTHLRPGGRRVNTPQFRRFIRVRFGTSGAACATLRLLFCHDISPIKLHDGAIQANPKVASLPRFSVRIGRGAKICYCEPAERQVG